MNPVENPLIQMMQAFGAAPADSAAALAGLQGTSGEADTALAAQFSGYVESSEPASGAVASTAFADTAKTRTQLAHGVPADAAFAVDPSASVAQAEFVVQTLPANSLTLQSLFADGTATSGQITPETAEAFSLAVNYHSSKPAALSASDLEALQSAAPASFASLSAAQATDNSTNTTGALSLGPIAGAQNPPVPGQFLPASDLKFLFSETPTLPTAASAGNQLLTTGANFGANVPPNPALVTNAPNAQQATGPITGSLAATPVVPIPASVETAIAPLASNISASTEQLSLMGDKSVAFEGGSEPSRANAAAAGLPAHGAQQSVDAKLDADGQILAVAQKGQNQAGAAGVAAAPAKATQIAQAQNQAQTQVATQAMAPASQLSSPESSNTAKRDAKSTDSLTGEATRTKTATAPMTPTLSAPTQVNSGNLNWTSPWITPERATGWPDGFATSLVATGLGGLTGNHGGLSGMSMLGGQPNATLGAQVTKQLNLNMTRAVKAGEQEFSMRMDPPELGRVSVKLRFGQNGLVRSQIMAERPETLELLQREMRGLERAIEAGGHKSEQGGISFSLDSGSHESAGKAFAEALQEDRLKEEVEGRSADHGDGAFTDDDTEIEIDLDEILAHVTPETGLDVRV